MAQSNNNTTRIIFRNAKAACPRCGGWTTFGGMSQHAECTSPKVCAERRLQWLEQRAERRLQWLEQRAERRLQLEQRAERRLQLEQQLPDGQRLVNMIAALTDVQRSQLAMGWWISADAEVREVMALQGKIAEAAAK